MRTVLLSLAAAAALATPAMANEARVEARGGIFWIPSVNYDEATAGVAAGYDYDLGSNAFAGVEVSGDKVLDSNTRVSLGIGGRLGLKLGEAGKLYVASSYQTKPCKGCVDSVSAGAGYQHTLTGNIYGKAEYRHFFTSNGAPDANAVLVGVGTKF